MYKNSRDSNAEISTGSYILMVCHDKEKKAKKKKSKDVLFYFFRM